MKSTKTTTPPVIICLLALIMILVINLVSKADGQERGDSRLPAAKNMNSSPTLHNLTDRERAWLAEHPVIRVVQDPGWPPVEFADKKGEPVGMSSDYLNLIEQRLGITFERVRVRNWQEAYTGLKSWKIDLTTSVAITPERLEFWSFTKPYMKIPIVIVTHRDVTYIGNMRELAGKKIAVVDGYAVTDWIPRDFPDIQLVKVKNAKAGLERLEAGEVFAFIDNMLVIGYYLAKLKISDLKIAGETPYLNAQSMAVRKDWTILTGILQKALDSISEAERDDIYHKWVPIRYDHGFNYTLLWQALAIFAVILGAMFFWNRKLAQEIRSRQNAEESLIKSEHRFRLLFNVAPVPLSFVDRNGVLLDINEQFIRTFGFSHEEIPTLKEWRKRAYPDGDYRNWVTKNWEDAMRRADLGNSVIDPIEFQVTRKDGTLRTVIISGTVIDGDYLSVFFDITDRKQAEEALKESEQLFRTLVEGAPDAIVVQTNERFAYLNRSAISLFGQAAEEELLGQPILDWIHPLSRDSVLEHIKFMNQAREKDPIHEERILRADGTTVLVEISAVPVNFKGENGALIFIRDITERKNMEHQLQQAQKMEAIGTLAGGISHDFNNLLQAINGFTQILLLDKQADDPDYSKLKSIEIAGNRAADLVRQLLFFSRKVEARRKPLDLNEEVKQAHGILERTIPKMIDLNLHLGGPLWPVNADPIQIEQVLLNLGTNAADAMPEGGILLIETENVIIGQDYINTHLGAVPGRYVLLSVSDTGQGIDKETAEHIFEPFFTTKEIGKGTGLGLASVFGIIKSHGGYISCYSEVGQGTNFKIYLPASEQMSVDEPQITIGESPQGGTETILLVDDEQSIRDFASQILGKFGYAVLTAASGEEALNIHASRPDLIDLVIMDIGMPGMGGHRCMSELIKRTPLIKVVIASGYPKNGQIGKALKGGAAGYVGKPYRLAELLDTVRAVLDQEK